MNRRTRAGLLGLLLVLAVETGAVAQLPEPTPLYAPDDLASHLPQQVGDSDFVVLWEELPIADDREGDFWSALLERLGKDVEDVQAAGGVTVPPAGFEADDIPFVIWAFRIDGVPAEDWAVSYVEAGMAVTDDPEWQADHIADWRVIEGRDTYGVTLKPDALAELRALSAPMHVPDDNGHWLYPVGEVLYWIGIPLDWPEPPPTIEDALASLP